MLVLNLILDSGLTNDKSETFGVPLIGDRKSKALPAFFCRTSPFEVRSVWTQPEHCRAMAVKWQNGS
ncbi:pseudouridine-5'-phosphate glycosidase [Shigella flexneri]